MEIESLIYVSRGNVPAISANATQVVKMTQGFAQHLSDVSLVTSGDIKSLFVHQELDFEQWYGSSQPFKIVQLPLRWDSTYPLPRWYGPRGFALYGALYSIYKRPDLVYSRSFNAIWMAVRMGIPSVIEIHSPKDDGPVLKRLLETGHLLGLVVISSYFKDYYCGTWNLPEDRVWVCPDGVDLTIYDDQKSKADWRRELGLPIDRSIAAYTGQLYVHRGIEAIMECAKRMPEVLFLIVGGYPEDVEQRKREASEMGLENLLLVGHVAHVEVPGFMKAADLLLMPYSPEGRTGDYMSPLKMFEYMGADRPIVATELEILKEVIAHEQTALFIKPNSVESMYQAIKRLIAEPELGNAIAARARRDVVQYTWANRARGILDLCERSL